MHMRVTSLVFALIVSTAGAAFGQGWTEYTNKEEGFRVDFPGPPKMAEIKFKSEYGAELPAHVYSVARGPERYSITAVDYSDAPRLLDEKAKAICPKDYADERSCGLSN